MIVYHIRNWSRWFENSKSRQIEACRYVCMPNKQDGLGLLRILSERDGGAIFGAWCLILQACSRQSKRAGWLTDDGTEIGRPWDLEDLSFRWRRPIGEIQRCLDVVCSPKIAWMEQLQSKCPSGVTECPPRDLKEGRKEGRNADRPATDTDDVDQGDITTERPLPKATAEAHLNKLRAIGLWLDPKDPTAREIALTAIEMYGGAALELRAQRLKRGRGTKPVFLNEITSDPEGQDEDPHRAQARKLVDKHGWEACREASGIPRDRIGSPDRMIEAMVAGWCFIDAVVAKLGAA